jgi:integrase
LHLTNCPGFSGQYNECWRFDLLSVDDYRKSIDVKTIYDLMAKRAKAAGVKRFSPHDLRRTFAGDLLDAGADIATVQRIMGHSDSNTTAGYAHAMGRAPFGWRHRRGERSKKEAIGRLHMAWERRY